MRLFWNPFRPIRCQPCGFFTHGSRNEGWGGPGLESKSPAVESHTVSLSGMSLKIAGFWRTFLFFGWGEGGAPPESSCPGSTAHSWGPQTAIYIRLCGSWLQCSSRSQREHCYQSFVTWSSQSILSLCQALCHAIRVPLLPNVIATTEVLRFWRHANEQVTCVSARLKASGQLFWTDNFFPVLEKLSWIGVSSCKCQENQRTTTVRCRCMCTRDVSACGVCNAKLKIHLFAWFTLLVGSKAREGKHRNFLRSF